MLGLSFLRGDEYLHARAQRLQLSFDFDDDDDDDVFVFTTLFNHTKLLYFTQSINQPPLFDSQGQKSNKQKSREQ